MESRFVLRQNKGHVAHTFQGKEQGHDTPFSTSIGFHQPLLFSPTTWISLGASSVIVTVSRITCIARTNVASKTSKRLTILLPFLPLLSRRLLRRNSHTQDI